MRNAIAGLALASVLLPAAPIVAEDQDEKWQQEIEGLRQSIKDAEKRWEERFEQEWQAREAYARTCIKKFFASISLPRVEKSIPSKTKAEILAFLVWQKEKAFQDEPFLWVMDEAKYAHQLNGDLPKHIREGIMGRYRERPERPRIPLMVLGMYAEKRCVKERNKLKREIWGRLRSDP